MLLKSEWKECTRTVIIEELYSTIFAVFEGYMCQLH